MEREVLIEKHIYLFFPTVCQIYFLQQFISYRVQFWRLYKSEC